MRKLLLTGGAFLIFCSPAAARDLPVATWGGASPVTSRPPMSAEVQTGANGARANVGLTIVCDGAREFFQDVDAARGRVAGDVFTASGADRVPLVGGALRYRWRLRLRLSDQGGTGTLATSGSARSRARGARKCRASNAVTVRTLDLTTRPGPGPFQRPAGPGRFFGGQLFTQYGVALDVDRRGRATARWNARVTCDGGGSTHLFNLTPSTPIDPDGRFRRVERFVERPQPGLLYRWRATFGGRFKSTGAIGNLEARLLVYRDKRLVNRCRSGKESWRVVRSDAFVAPLAEAPARAASAWRLSFADEGSGQSGTPGSPDDLAASGNASFVALDAGEVAARFSAPVGQPLRPGVTYTGAQLEASRTTPGMSVILNAKSCSQISGQFTVRAITRDLFGRPQRAVIDFEQHCEGGPAALRGTWDVTV